MGVLMPTPNTEVSAHGYAMDAPLRPIEGERNFRYPHGPRDGPVTNYYTRNLLVEAGEYDPLPPPEEVRLHERARISRRYVQDQQRQQPTAFFGPQASSSSRPASQPVDQQRNAQVVKRKLGPMAKGMAKKRARR